MPDLACLFYNYVSFKMNNKLKTFGSDLICNTDIKGKKFVCVGVDFLAFNVLLHIKSEQKVINFAQQ